MINRTLVTIEIYSTMYDEQDISYHRNILKNQCIIKQDIGYHSNILNNV